VLPSRCGPNAIEQDGANNANGGIGTQEFENGWAECFAVVSFAVGNYLLMAYVNLSAKLFSV
jgi:hypothetical protein